MIPYFFGPLLVLAIGVAVALAFKLGEWIIGKSRQPETNWRFRSAEEWHAKDLR